MVQIFSLDSGNADDVRNKFDNSDIEIVNKAIKRCIRSNDFDANNYSFNYQDINFPLIDESVKEDISIHFSDNNDIAQSYCNGRKNRRGWIQSIYF